jgi:hypothetical protein
VGLLTGLLTLPLAPVRGVVSLAETIHDEAERVYYDPATIHRELERLDDLRRAGEIDETEAATREEALVQRLLEGRDR